MLFILYITFLESKRHIFFRGFGPHKMAGMSTPSKKEVDRWVLGCSGFSSIMRISFFSSFVGKHNWTVLSEERK